MYKRQELGYLQSTVTGNYMNKTVEAVSKFQKAIGLSETGVATASLQEVLFSSSAPRYNASTPTATPTTGYTQLSFGSTGQAVAEMQQRLIDLGYLSGCLLYTSNMYYLPSIAEYSRNAWKMDYEQLKTLYEAWHGRIFECNGVVVDSFCLLYTSRCV